MTIRDPESSSSSRSSVTEVRPLAARVHADQYWLHRLLDAIETIEQHGICRVDLDCLAPSEENRIRMFLGILQDYALGYQEEGEQPRLSAAFRRLLEGGSMEAAEYPNQAGQGAGEPAPCFEPPIEPPLAARVHALIAPMQAKLLSMDKNMRHLGPNYPPSAYYSGNVYADVRALTDALEAAISPSDTLSDSVPNSEPDSAQPLASATVNCDKCADKYAAVHALIAQWRKQADELALNPWNASVTARVKRDDADALEAALAAAQPEPCVCGEADGMAVYSAECPNELHANRARKVAALAAALAPNAEEAE